MPYRAYTSLPSNESGTGNATRAVALNGNQAIDGLLTTVAWAGSSIDYSFPTSGSLYGYAQDADVPAGFFALTVAQRNAAQFALDADLGVNAAATAGFAAEGFTNLGVSLDATAGTDQIRLANTTAGSVPTAQVADFPGNYLTQQTADNGDVWFGTAYAGTIDDYVNPTAGNFAWHTHIHEVGHALGLKHGHENSLDGPMPANVDSMEFTVMTYRSYIGEFLGGGYQNEQWGFAQTWMMYDIAALQHMYGADFTTNAGDTVYKWAPGNGNTLVNGAVGIAPGGNRIFATIWDGGGVDTYDLSSYSGGVDIDLNPGAHSTFSNAQLAALGDGNTARGNVFNALQYRGDSRSMIENAIGGAGADAITGNRAANALVGNAGADTLFGGDGVDTLYGNDGNDLVSGGLGNDVIDGGRNLDTVRGGAGNDRISGGFDADIVIGGAGLDTFFFNELAGSAPGARDQLRAGDGGAAFDAAGAAAGDLFDLSRIDANTTAGGNQAFQFGGVAQFGKGFVWFANAGRDTILRVNVNNSAAAEFEIEIEDGAILASAYRAQDVLL